MKSICINGHSFVDNKYINTKGIFVCKICHKNSVEKYRKKLEESGRIIYKWKNIRGRVSKEDLEYISGIVSSSDTRAYQKFYYRCYNLRHKYGIGLKDFHDLLKKQDMCCAICKKRKSLPEDLVVDHNHENGNVRGLLCNTCNRGIGFFFDDSEIMKSAIRYIESML